MLVAIRVWTCEWQYLSDTWEPISVLSFTKRSITTSNFTFEPWYFQSKREKKEKKSNEQIIYSMMSRRVLTVFLCSLSGHYEVTGVLPAKPKRHKILYNPSLIFEFHNKIRKSENLPFFWVSLYAETSTQITCALVIWTGHVSVSHTLLLLGKITHLVQFRHAQSYPTEAYVQARYDSKICKENQAFSFVCHFHYMQVGLYWPTSHVMACRSQDHSPISYFTYTYPMPTKVLDALIYRKSCHIDDIAYLNGHTSCNCMQACNNAKREFTHHYMRDSQPSTPKNHQLLCAHCSNPSNFVFHLVFSRLGVIWLFKSWCMEPKVAPSPELFGV